MKLLKTKPVDSVRERAITNLQAELYRVRVAVDELKAAGSIEDLDAAQRVLWGTLLIIDGLLRRGSVHENTRHQSPERTPPTRKGDARS